MLGVIVAAGKASRLDGKCKSLLMINGKYVIETILENMKELGIKKIYIIVNGIKIIRSIGYEYYGVELIYIQQPKQNGLKEAIMLCRDLKENMCIFLGDILYIPKKYELIEAKESFEEKVSEKKANSAITYKPCDDFREIIKSYGITTDGKIIEKPDLCIPIKNWLGLGIYFATPEIFKYLEHEEIFMNVFNQMDCLSLKLEGNYHNINTEEDFKNANCNPI